MFQKDGLIGNWNATEIGSIFLKDPVQLFIHLYASFLSPCVFAKSNPIHPRHSFCHLKSSLSPAFLIQSLEIIQVVAPPSQKETDIVGCRRTTPQEHPCHEERVSKTHLNTSLAISKDRVPAPILALRPQTGCSLFVFSKNVIKVILELFFSLAINLPETDSSILTLFVAEICIMYDKQNISSFNFSFFTT